MVRLLVSALLSAAACIGTGISTLAQAPSTEDSSAQQPKPGSLGTRTDEHKRLVRLGAQSSPLPQSPALPSFAESNSNPKASQQERGEFIFAPIPFSNQVFSFGLIPVVAYLFSVDPDDHTSPESTLGLVGMIAQRSSWAIGGGGRLILHHDLFRVTSFGGHGSVSYELFGVGSANGDAGHSVLIQQSGDLVGGEFLVRLFSKLYFGPRYNYRNLTATLDPQSSNAPAPTGLNPSDLGAEFKTRGPGFKLLFDTRSAQYFPTSGDEFELVGDFYGATRFLTTSAQNQNLDYQSYQLSENHYFSLAPKDILGVRGMVCSVNGNPPFYELCQFGAFGDIRGYQPGRYRDNRMFATQAEYRRILTRRWGFSVFGGIGEVAPSWNKFNTGNLLPGGGAGARFNLSKQERINLRADLAYGKNGWSWVFSLGEAF
jgi:hypothetical protein